MASHQPTKESEGLLAQLKAAIVQAQAPKAIAMAKEAIARGVAADLMIKIIHESMAEVDELYRSHEYFISEVASSAAVAEQVFKIIERSFEPQAAKPIGTIVLGSARGNVQTLGKNIVAAMLRASGFTVIDLGADVPAFRFAKEAERTGADIIAVSLTLEETLPSLEDLKQEIRARGLQGRVKVMIGGKAASERVREQFQFDAYARDGAEAVAKARDLVATKRPKDKP